MTINTTITDEGKLLHITGDTAQSLFYATARAHMKAVEPLTTFEGDPQALFFDTIDCRYVLHDVCGEQTLTLKFHTNPAR